MAGRGLFDTVVYVCAAGESGAPEERGLSQADGGVGMHNGAPLPVLMATRLRADIARQSASLLGCACALYHGSTRAQRGRRVEDR